jgi:Domain of unknown function (DUF4167)
LAAGFVPELVNATAWDGACRRSDILNFDNGHRPRQGQHNKNRGRNRNNRRPGSGGGGQHHTGGNSVNRVYESNGPDVKVRGTAQTVAEKYMQLGRDAHSSGDSVMAESYYQFAEHYFRVMQAAQPVGQPSQQLRRPEDEEFEEDGDAPSAEGDVEAVAQPADVPPATGEEAAEAPQAQGGEQRNARPREGRERFRPRWQNRKDRPEQEQPEANGSDAPVEAEGPWEAPSFLTRPAPAVSDDGEGQSRSRTRRSQPKDEAPADESSEPVQD